MNITNLGEYNPLNKELVVGSVLAPKEEGRTGYAIVLLVEGDNCIITTDFGNILSATKNDILCCYSVEGQQNLRDRFEEQLTKLNDNYFDMFGKVFEYIDVRDDSGQRA